MEHYFLHRNCRVFRSTNSISLSFQGGEVVQETITSNVHDDIITLEFQRTDGTLITQLIDFRSVSINVERLSWWSNISCARPFLRLTMPISTMPRTVEKMSNFLNYVRCCSALLCWGVSCSLFIAHKQWTIQLVYYTHVFRQQPSLDMCRLTRIWCACRVDGNFISWNCIFLVLLPRFFLWGCCSLRTHHQICRTPVELCRRGRT